MSQLALIYESPNKQSVQPLAIPEPLEGYVLVRVEAAAFNPLDYKIYDYTLGFVEKYPSVLGVDAAGVVTKTGPDVTKFKVGDRVAFICDPNHADGAHNGERVSSFPVGGNTAAGALYGQLKSTDPWLGGEGAYKGEQIVILGGSSCVGAYSDVATQILAAAQGPVKYVVDAISLSPSPTQLLGVEVLQR
ncbi:chaperonin 10-like protein [Mycena crocata]|nr:chaperonin 10-like protein [Mycena crocata]